MRAKVKVCWSLRRPGTARVRGEDGVGIMDVTVAVTILLLVLVPAALLITSINASSGSANHRVVALGVASSYVDEVQALQGNVPPNGRVPPYTASIAPYNAYLNLCGGAGGCSTWPVQSQNASPFPTDQVDGLTYKIAAAGGWCQEATATAGNKTSWIQPPASGGYTAVQTTYAPPVGASSTVNIYAYWIAVRVTWYAGSQNQGQVIQFAALIPPGPTVQAAWPTLGSLATNGVPTAANAALCPTSLS